MSNKKILLIFNISPCVICRIFTTINYKREEEMGKIRKFLGFFVFLVSVVFGANAFATGYVCDDIKKYTSCDVGY